MFEDKRFGVAYRDGAAWRIQEKMKDKVDFFAHFDDLSLICDGKHLGW